MNIETHPIDITIIKSLVGDDPDLIQYFFKKFLDTVPDNFNEIDAAISRNDFTGVRANAHKMKSSAKAIGANALSDICENIENESVQQNRENIDKLFVKLANEFNACKKYIHSN